MKRRWFLAGLALSTVGAGCNAAADSSREGAEASGPKALRNSKTLVVATSANYPPYEYIEGEASVEDVATEEDLEVVGFDIDLARLIAERLDRQLELVDLEFNEIIPSLVNDDVDMAIAAIEPNRSRKQRVDFSTIYYRSRQALISLDGYLRSRDLAYQIIGIRAGSVQARYANRLGEDYPNLDIVPYDSIEEIFEALDIGAIEGAFLEANVASEYLRRYPDFEAQIMPSDQPTGSAIAFPKNSPLRREINSILSDLKSNGEVDELIEKWFV